MVFGDWLTRWACYTPDKVALIEDATGRRLTYREFNRRANRLASALRSGLGVNHGDRVAVLAHNCNEIFELLFAVGKIGAILVPLNHRLATSELAAILADCEPKVVVVGPEFVDHVGELGLPVDTAIVPLEAHHPWTDYEALLELGMDEMPAGGSVSLDDPVLILYTSGTTGKPKGAMLTHGTLTWNAVNTEVGWDLRHDDVTLTHTPLFHTGGLNALSTPLLHRGGTVILMRSFDAERSLALIARERCTVIFAVPTMFQMMLNAPNFASSDLSSVRFFITGGSPCPVPLIEAYASRGVVFKQGYGLTEAGPNCFTLDAKDAVRKAGSVGFPNFYQEVLVVDEQGRAVRPGEVGELLIRGPHVFKGYWRNPEATAASLQNGWLHTGDLVRRDEEGYYAIVDRKKDMYISGGENVYPAEVERLLHGHPSIHEAAIIAVPDEKWGEVGRAVVVLKPGAKLTLEQVISFLDGKTARYKLPKSVCFVDALPRNSTGKVQKQVLRRQHVPALV
jgi:fatty-acyl-CoA synthase